MITAVRVCVCVCVCVCVPLGTLVLILASAKVNSLKSFHLGGTLERPLLFLVLFLQHHLLCIASTPTVGVHMRCRLGHWEAFP